MNKGPVCWILRGTSGKSFSFKMSMPPFDSLYIFTLKCFVIAWQRNIVSRSSFARPRNIGGNNVLQHCFLFFLKSELLKTRILARRKTPKMWMVARGPGTPILTYFTYMLYCIAPPRGLFRHTSK